MTEHVGGTRWLRTLVVKRGGVKRRMKGGEYRRGMERAEGMEP